MQQHGNNSGAEVIRKFDSHYVLSMSRDIPLLLTVRDATFINRHQLEELMPPSPEQWKSRNTRIRRLIAPPMCQLVKHPRCFPYPGNVFSITRAGLRSLEIAGHGLLSITSETESLGNTDQIPHFLGINAIQIGIRKAFNLINWYGDRYLKSMNIAVNQPTAKDYDSIAFLASADDPNRPIRVGIEYERFLKSKERYAEIRKNLSGEKQINGLVYFADNDLIANQLAAMVYSTTLPICVATINELYRAGNQCTALMVRDRKIVRAQMSQILDELCLKSVAVGS